MALSNGSRGSAVTDLQKQLKAAGFDPGPIDGIYGPKTAAAVTAYQKANNLTVDGIAGSQTLGALGLKDDTDANKTDYTDDDTTRFNGLPGEPEIWKDKDTGRIYVVYYPEGMDPPVPLRYVVNSEEVLKTYFGDKAVVYDHEYTTAEMESLGAITFGDVGEIEDTTGDPWSGFTIKMEKAREAMPWLDDPEVFSIIASAYLEGRVPEPYEFSDTKWYSSHNEAERAWLTKVAQDPKTALDDMDDARAKVRDKFLDLGLPVPDEGIIDYIAEKWRQGTWSLQDRDDQINVITGGGEGVVVDEGLATIVGGTDLGTPTSQVDTVKALWNRWLGSAYPPSEAQIAEWAGILRDDESGGTSRLTEMLRGQRMALFSEYEDDTLTWDDISGPWKGMAYNVWGVQAEDNDEEFVNIVRGNDSVEAAKTLRRIGLDRGYERVTTAAANSLERGMATGVKGVV